MIIDLSLDEPRASRYNLRWLLWQPDGTICIRTLKRVIFLVEGPLRCDGLVCIPLATATMVIVALVILIQYRFAVKSQLITPHAISRRWHVFAIHIAIHIWSSVVTRLRCESMPGFGQVVWYFNAWNSTSPFLGYQRVEDR